MLKTCCLNLDISIVNLSNSSSTVSFSSFFLLLLRVPTQHLILFFFFYVLPFKPRHCFCPFHSFQLYPDINTFLTTPIHADNIFCVTRVQLYNFLQVGCFCNLFYLCIVSTMYWRLSCCLQTHVSLSESLGRVTQNGLHRKKASMAYIDVGIFYNKFLVEFSYAVEHNSPLFFSLLFVKVTLITDVIHLDISASSLGDTIVVFRDPYLFSDDIVSVFHRTTKQWL